MNPNFSTCTNLLWGYNTITSTLFILNDAPYGNERPYNALRLDRALAGEEKKHSTLAELTDWTAAVDKVLVF